MNEKIAGVILAGGQSRRMGGGDKSLLPLGGRTALDHVVSRLAPQVRRLALNANGDPARFGGFGLPVVSDTVEGFAGPLAGILAGLEWASATARCPAIVTAAGDTPFFPADLVARLAAAITDPAMVAVACSGGKRHPTFALWPVSVHEDLSRFLTNEDNRRISAFIDRQKFIEVDFPMQTFGGRDIDPFFNINTPDDLAEADRLLRSMESR